MQGKECTKCNEWKEFEDFHKDKNKKDGHKNYCRECYKNKIYSYNNEGQGTEKRKPYIKIGYNGTGGKSPKPIIIKDNIEGKECTRCGEWNALTNYHKFSRQAYGLDIYCKPCALKMKKAHNQTEQGKNTAHRSAVKYRSRKKGAKITPYTRSEILRRDKYTCQFCGIKVHDRSSGNWNTPNKAHLDHIVSLEEGGDTTPENLQTLCRSCNLSKGSTSKGELQMTLF